MAWVWCWWIWTCGSGICDARSVCISHLRNQNTQKTERVSGCVHAMFFFCLALGPFALGAFSLLAFRVGGVGHFFRGWRLLFAADVLLSALTPFFSFRLGVCDHRFCLVRSFLSLFRFASLPCFQISSFVPLSLFFLPPFPPLEFPSFAFRLDFSTFRLFAFGVSPNHPPFLLNRPIDQLALSSIYYPQLLPSVKSSSLAHLSNEPRYDSPVLVSPLLSCPFLFSLMVDSRMFAFSSPRAVRSSSLRTKQNRSDQTRTVRSGPLCARNEASIERGAVRLFSFCPALLRCVQRDHWGCDMTRFSYTKTKHETKRRDTVLSLHRGTRREMR